MNQTTDLHKQLIEACKQNDAKAQMKLYDVYCKAMCIVAHRYVKDSYVAEDIMQDSFIKAFQNINSFKGEVSFGAWIKRIVINNSLDWLKKQKLELVSINEEVYQKTEEDHDWSIAHQIRAESIVNTINSLKEKYRLVLSLYLLEGYDHQEIAQVLGITEVTSRTNLMRGKKQLQELLKEQQYVEGY
ncbi:MAG: RNA polymerase sigma factor [Flavobacteriaceae bacterium]|nr:RNA polymerase sigma factor [Flavobacteriaceae bacterium]